jgi:hypothetical protein
MATTTNYSWSTPDDTALVKDGAAAIRSLGTAIDSTVFTNAGAAINKTIVDAKGDLIVASGADAVARLAVGTNDHVLTADSGATNGVKWAAVPSGGITLLSTTSLSGSSVTISTISQDYKNLQIYIEGAYASSAGEFNCRINGITSSTYAWSNVYAANSSAGAEDSIAVAQIRLNRIGTSADYDKQNTTILNIYRYAETSPFTKIFSQGRTRDASNHWMYTGMGTQSTAGALTSITFFPQSGTFSGGTVYIYGVK